MLLLGSFSEFLGGKVVRHWAVMGWVDRKQKITKEYAVRPIRKPTPLKCTFTEAVLASHCGDCNCSCERMC